MDLLTLLGILVRRWYVVVPTLLLTALAAYMVDTRVPDEFEATGWVLIESPALNQTGEPSGTDILALGDELAADPPNGLPSDAEFVVQPGDTPASFVVSAAADSASGAEQTVNVVTAALQDRLAQAQADAAVDEFARLELRQALPRAIPSEATDGTFTASMPLDLRDPASGVANPYGPNPGTGRLLQVAIMGDAGRAQFSAQFDGSVAYSIDQTARDAAALLQITTTGANRQDVIAAFFTLQEVLDAELDERQARAGVPESRRVRVTPFDAPLQATDVSPPVHRATAAVLLLGGLLSIAAGVAANRFLPKRGTGQPTDAPPARTAAAAPTSRGTAEPDAPTKGRSTTRTTGKSTTRTTAKPTTRTTDASTTDASTTDASTVRTTGESLARPAPAANWATKVEDPGPA